MISCDHHVDVKNARSVHRKLSKRFLNNSSLRCILQQQPVKNFTDCCDCRRAKPKLPIINHHHLLFGHRRGKDIYCECIRLVSVPQSNTLNLLNHLNKHHSHNDDECLKANKNNIIPFLSSVNSDSLNSCAAACNSTMTTVKKTTKHIFHIYIYICRVADMYP